MLLRSTLAVALVVPLACPRLLYSGPEDLYAFPKYRVTFLNDLPILNETAQRWIQHGLPGGEQEFLGESSAWYPQAAMKEIAGSESVCMLDMYPSARPTDPVQSDTPAYSFQHMKIGPDTDFLCLIPPAGDTGTTTGDFDGDAALQNSWSLLQPLSGKCLYVRSPYPEAPSDFNSPPVSIDKHGSPTLIVTITKSDNLKNSHPHNHP